MAYARESVPDLTGRTAVVTGANGGLALLMPALLAAPAARVVTVTSTARHLGRRVDADDPHMHRGYGPWRAYARSELANYHFGLGLQREFDRAGVDAMSLLAHPGLSRSNLQVHTVEQDGGGRSARFWAWLARTTGMEVEDGAVPQIRAATDPRARGGQLYGPRFANTGRAVRLPVLRPGAGAAIRTLWTVCERETGIAVRI